MITLEHIQQQICAGQPLQIIGSASHVEVKHADTIDMSHYQGIVEYYPEELVMSVKAGTTLQDIEHALSAHQQALPFYTDSQANATIGGAYAMGNAELRDAVLGVKVIDGQGRLLTFGGQTMKNVAGYDVARLLVGSKGQLAVICEISFKVFPQHYLNDIERTALQHSIQSPLRTRIEQGLKQVFDPHQVFV